LIDTQGVAIQSSIGIEKKNALKIHIYTKMGEQKDGAVARTKTGTSHLEDVIGKLRQDGKTLSAASSKSKTSKRQKRLEVNDRHKWPQHPKIQSMEVREKAYLRVAGLGSSSPSSNNNKKKKKQQQEAVDPKLDLMSPEAKFLRLLGGTDQRTRHAAVRKLKSYLEARCDINNETGGLSENDLMKLWKGLWYTLYMADKVPVQNELSKRLAELLWCVAGTEEEDEYAGQAYLKICEEQEQDEMEGDDDTSLLAATMDIIEGEDDDDDDDAGNDDDDDDGNDINDDSDGSEDAPEEKSSDDDDNNDNADATDDADIPHCRGAHLASLFIRTFLRTVHREWGRMDKYRIDKFYTVLRLYVHQMYKYMSMRHWNLGIIRLFNDCIFEEILSKTPNGLRYHFIDICLDELASVNHAAAMPLTEATFLDALEPYFAMAQSGGNDSTGTIQSRVIENVLVKFLNRYSVVGVAANAPKGDGGDGNADDLKVFDQVHVETVANFIFEMASDPGTKDNYRKSLYDVHKQYMRRKKEVGKDVELNDIECVGAIEDMVEYNDEGNEIDEKSGEGEDGGDCCATNSCTSKSCAKETSTTPDVVAQEEDDEDIYDEDADKTVKKEKKDKKAKKKKKKKKRKADSMTTESEEEIVITVSEQKQARLQRKKTKSSVETKVDVTKTKTTTKSSPDGNDSGGSPTKRVKFTSVNRCRSFKASMRGLDTKLPMASPPATPEKSILRKTALRKSALAKRGASRRKASSYF